MGEKLRFSEEDPGVPTTPRHDPDPEPPSQSGLEPTDEEMRRTSGAGPDPTPSHVDAAPSEGVSESAPGDGM